MIDAVIAPLIDMDKAAILAGLIGYGVIYQSLSGLAERGDGSNAGVEGYIRSAGAEQKRKGTEPCTERGTLKHASWHAGGEKGIAGHLHGDILTAHGLPDRTGHNSLFIRSGIDKILNKIDDTSGETFDRAGAWIVSRI
jgi:hypothetical protein